MSAAMLFDGWSPIARTLITGVCAYAALVVLLRVSGKRTLSKMNAFDLVVTVALGSTLASILTSRDVALAQGVAALALLVALQFVLTWLSVRSHRVRRLVRSEPALLVYQGRSLEAVLRRERITPEELEAAVRDTGVASMEEAGAVVLETDGTVSVVRRDARPADAARSTLPRTPSRG